MFLGYWNDLSHLKDWTMTMLRNNTGRNPKQAININISTCTLYMYTPLSCTTGWSTIGSRIGFNHNFLVLTRWVCRIHNPLEFFISLSGGSAVIKICHIQTHTHDIVITNSVADQPWRKETHLSASLWMSVAFHKVVRDEWMPCSRMRKTHTHTSLIMYSTCITSWIVNCSWNSKIFASRGLHMFFFRGWF